MKVSGVNFFAIVAFLAFFSMTFAKPSVSLDSLSGVVEIQRAGTVKWEYATKESKIFHNDLVRIPDSGLAILKWPDGTKSFLHKKSQMLVTIFQKKNSTDIMSNVTVMFGAAFFVVKKMLPKDKSDEMKVYTPTAVLSIRGTSFLVNVDTVEKTTQVKMVNGLVMVKNILKNVSVLLGTPYQTEIKNDLNPSSPKAVLKSDLDSMKIWVPETVIEEEIARQIENTKQDRIELASDYQDRCLITQFTNSSKYKGTWDISQEFTRYFSTILRRNLTKTVVMIADTIVNNPEETAKNVNARYYITGTIDKFELAKHAEISTKGDEYREAVVAKASITIKLYDMAQSTTILTETFAAEFSGKNTADNSWENLNKRAFNLADSTFTKTIIGNVAANSIVKSVDAVSKKIQ